MRKRNLLAVALLLASLPALAGVSFIAVGRAEGQDGDMRIHALVSGNRIKVSVLSSADPVFAAGTYMLSTDGGKTMFLVTPATHTYLRYDNDEMMNSMGDVVGRMRGSMKLVFESPKVEKILEEDGGQIAGLSTRHYRYRTTYSMTLQVAGAKRLYTTIVEDIWATSELRDPALAVWLKKPPATTGDAELDGLIRAEMNKVQGFPLKRVRVSTSTDADGVPHTDRTEMEVTELKQQLVPESEFVIPRNYRDIEPLLRRDQ